MYPYLSHARILVALLPAIALTSTAGAQTPTKDSPFLPPATAAAATNGTTSYEFAGMSVAGKATLLSIVRTRDKRSFWVPVGQTVGEITAVSYDPKTDQATIKAEGFSATRPGCDCPTGNPPGCFDSTASRHRAGGKGNRSPYAGDRSSRNRAGTAPRLRISPASGGGKSEVRQRKSGRRESLIRGDHREYPLAECALVGFRRNPVSQVGAGLPRESPQ